MREIEGEGRRLKGKKREMESEGEREGDRLHESELVREGERERERERERNFSSFLSQSPVCLHLFMYEFNQAECCCKNPHILKDIEIRK